MIKRKQAGMAAVLAGFLFLGTWTNAADSVLWTIGLRDNSAEEFALAPGNFKAYQHPGLYVEGVSNPKIDWPYAQPGPLNTDWAPDTPQIFEIVFGLAAAPAGPCRLVMDLVDCAPANPPLIRVDVNGVFREVQAQPGAGEDSLRGDTSKGREQVLTLEVPATDLRPGDNHLVLTVTAGSWLVWDAVAFEAPAGALSTPVEPCTRILEAATQPVLVWDGGKKTHPVAMEVLHIGKPQNVQVRAGETRSSTELKPGRQTLNMCLPPVAAAMTVPLAISREGAVLAAGRVTLKPVRDWEIHIIHQTHLDIGFTDRQEEVLKLQVAHLKNALRFIEETKDYPPEAQFRWHPEGMWAVDEFMRTATDAEKNAFLAACRTGHIHLDVLYAQAMTGMYNDEGLFELMGAAKRFEEAYGVPIVSAMQSDVPGYTWGLASVLAQNGVPYLSVGPNWFAIGDVDTFFKGPGIVGQTHRGGRVFRWADQPFWWESPSGKDRILFWMPGWGYSGFQCGRDAITPEKVTAYLNWLQSKDYPYDMVLWRYVVGADNGPPHRVLCDVVKAWNEHYASPRLIISTNSSAMKQFAERHGDKLPVVRGDFTPYWEDGSASTSVATAASRNAAEKLAQEEILWSMIDPALPLQERFDTAWNKIIMYDEHTWGAHNSISEPDSTFAVQQDQYKQAYAFDGAALTAALAGETTAAVRKDESGAVDVYNTASWTRDGLVLVDAKQSARGDRVQDDTGAAVSSQRLASGELAFVARNAPAFGARRYTIHKGRAHKKGAVKATRKGLSNGLLSLEFDPENGAIRSLNRAGMEGNLVDANAGGGLNDYLYILGRDADKRRARIEGPVKIVVEDKGPLVATVRIESGAPGCNKLTRWVRLVDGLDYVELTNTADKRRERRQEGVYFSFPFNVPGAQARIDVPWAVVRVEKDQMEGANRNFYCVQRWVDLSNENSGVTWVTMDAPMLQFDPIKIAQPFGLEYWREHIESGAHIYSWTMNNHWETNYKADQEGPITFRYALRPHAGGYDSVREQQFGRGVCQPLLAVPADPVKPMTMPLLALDDNSVVVTAIRPSRDGKAYMVRLFNTAETPKEVRLTWTRPVGQTWISNPMEDLLSEAPASLRMVPSEIVSLRVARQ